MFKLLARELLRLNLKLFNVLGFSSFECGNSKTFVYICGWSMQV